MVGRRGDLAEARRNLVAMGDVNKTVLVVGASGLIGHATAAQFSSEKEWKVVGLSRGSRPTCRE
jgi:NAD(P)-dependent dehydrogenase (short-subunit alcohol dehydrogenase family)